MIMMAQSSEQCKRNKTCIMHIKIKIVIKINIQVTMYASTGIQMKLNICSMHTRIHALTNTRTDPPLPFSHT